MSATPQRRSNRLAGETSAYLLQHRFNPVDGYPWGEEALARARDEDRPLLVSIGYSACHWCHVMERESFEDAGTAAVMNRHFVNVKVDREERPDVDQLYMDTALRMMGSGGWPLTVFCTPDGRPFYAGTYFPPRRAYGRPSFVEVLEAVADAYRTRRQEIERSAGQILDLLRERPTGVAREVPGRHTLVSAARRLMEGADRERGGFGDAPKFPTPTSLDVLLAACDVLPDDAARDALAHVVHSCREYARRGLFDQIGGGFHRYCVDGHLTIPHFEKMLYDQGQLARTFAEAWRRSGGLDEDLVWPVRETVAYLRREMAAPDGGYFASQDADSEGVEGRFFVWTPGEIEAALGRDRAAAFCAAYGVTPEGNFEHGATQLVDAARAPRERFADDRARLLETRGHRVAPATDRKRVAAWNALVISGLARAGSLLDDDAMLSDAAATADFVLQRMRTDDGRLLRVYDAGVARVPAFLDDYAGMLEACLDLLRAGAGDRYLGAALGFAREIATRFYDETEGDLFLTSADGERLVHRPRSEQGGATPDATGQAVLGLLRVAALCGDAELLAVADRVLRTHAFALERLPHASPVLACAAALADEGVGVAVVVGDPLDPRTRALASRARRVLAPEDAVIVRAPGQVPAGIDPALLEGRSLVSGGSAAYVCRGRRCSLPVTDPDALASAVSSIGSGSGPS
ncbi:MAG: thioredoxin domain-containing protein [Deltaproteobacteria bacterium]|nr:thioredoxin domain-containing protein [Deltaproteobacteria bacterium]